MAETSEWGHFLIDLQAVITFREDGPLRNESGRLDPASKRLELGPPAEARSCERLDDPPPSMPLPGH